MREENILTITVADEDGAVRVLDGLTRLAAEGGLTLHAAAILHRGDDGTMTVSHPVGQDVPAPHPLRRHLTTLIEVLIGAVDTIVLGNTGMALSGTAQPTPEAAALGHLARSIAPGVTAVVGYVSEDGATAVDGVAADNGATVERRDVARFEAEMASDADG